MLERIKLLEENIKELEELKKRVLLRECITLLKDFKYISEDLSSKITGMIGLRNLLVHEYVLLDLKKLFNFLAHLEDFKEFIKCVREYV